MAELAVAIMVVSLPSMRAYVRRGGIFAPKRTYGSFTSQYQDQHYRNSKARSEKFKLSSNAKKFETTQGHSDQGSGSEVELHILGRKDVIYESCRISVEFSDPSDDKPHGHYHVT